MAFHVLCYCIWLILMVWFKNVQPISLYTSILLSKTLKIPVRHWKYPYLIIMGHELGYSRVVEKCHYKSLDHPGIFGGHGVSKNGRNIRKIGFQCKKCFFLIYFETKKKRPPSFTIYLHLSWEDPKSAFVVFPRVGAKSFLGVRRF